MLLLTSQPYGCTLPIIVYVGVALSISKLSFSVETFLKGGSVVASAFRSPVMSVELFENRMLLVLSGLLIHLPYIIADETEDALLDPQLNTDEGKLAILLYIMILLVIILSIVLISCCCYFGRMYYKTRAGRKQKMRFKDTNEGDIELAEADVDEDKQDTNDKGEQKGEQGSGEESVKAAEEQTNKDTITLSTFGHTPADDKNTEEKEEAAKLDKDVVSGNDVTSKEISQESDIKQESKEKEAEEREGAASQENENKQKTDASKTVEAEEQTQGQSKPIPVPPPIINLNPKSKPSQPDTPADTSADTPKDTPADKPADTAADTAASESKDEAKKPPPTDTTDSEGKEETAKESKATETTSKAPLEEKSGEPAPEDSEVPLKPADQEGSSKPVMAFEDIEKALGLALQGLGDF